MVRRQFALLDLSSYEHVKSLLEWCGTLQDPSSLVTLPCLYKWPNMQACRRMPITPLRQLPAICQRLRSSQHISMLAQGRVSAIGGDDEGLAVQLRDLNNSLVCELRVEARPVPYADFIGNDTSVTDIIPVASSFPPILTRLLCMVPKTIMSRVEMVELATIMSDWESGGAPGLPAPPSADEPDTSAPALLRRSQRGKRPAGGDDGSLGDSRAGKKAKTKGKGGGKGEVMAPAAPATTATALARIEKMLVGKHVVVFMEALRPPACDAFIRATHFIEPPSSRSRAVVRS